MAESLVQVTEGVGKKLHTWQRAIGGQNVEDEVVLHGEQHLASYVITTTASVAVATANSHLLQIMAGATLNVIIRRIRVYEAAVFTAASLFPFVLTRLSTAGTGGGALTPAPLDTGDAASGCTAMTLPTVKGTETTQLSLRTAMSIQTVPTGGPADAALLAEWDFDKLRSKGLRIPSGAANGIAIKNPTAQAAGSVYIEVDLTELNHV